MKAKVIWDFDPLADPRQLRFSGMTKAGILNASEKKLDRIHARIAEELDLPLIVVVEDTSRRSISRLERMYGNAILMVEPI
jgi:hypothetical protein